jgi:hypothetical protein
MLCEYQVLVARAVELGLCQRERHSFIKDTAVVTMFQVVGLEEVVPNLKFR